MSKIVLIAGPCVIESEENIFKIAKGLESLANDDRIDFYFKSSFDKANRTSLDSYRGPGLDEGLKVLQKVKNDFGYKLLTDIHESYQAKPVAEVVDMLQIPAFLCRQTDLLLAAAKTKAKLNIKKGQFLSPTDTKHIVVKALKTRGFEEPTYENSKKAGVYLVERGSSFGYGNLVVDMRSFIIMREYAPVVFDATHSVQMPGMGDGCSSGKSEYVYPLARAAAAVGVDGFFFETHFDPSIALSDGANMIKLDLLKSKVDKLMQILDIKE